MKYCIRTIILCTCLCILKLHALTPEAIFSFSGYPLINKSAQKPWTLINKSASLFNDPVDSTSSIIILNPKKGDLPAGSVSLNLEAIDKPFSFILLKEDIITKKQDFYFCQLKQNKSRITLLIDNQALETLHGLKSLDKVLVISANEQACLTIFEGRSFNLSLNQVDPSVVRKLKRALSQLKHQYSQEDLNGSAQMSPEASVKEKRKPSVKITEIK